MLIDHYAEIIGKQLRNKTINKGLSLSSPILTYIVVWLVMIYLISLQLIKFYEPVNTNTYVLLLGGIFTFLIAWVLARLMILKREKFNIDKIELSVIEALQKYLRNFGGFWIFGNLLTIFLQGGFPLLWLFIGSEKGYADFGLPTFHGLLNALFAFQVVGHFICYQVKKERRHGLILLLILTYPLLIMSRGLFVLALIELLGIYLFIQKVRLFNLLKLIIGLLLFLFLFGWVGDLRLGENKDFIYELVNEEHLEQVQKVPSGFIWVYLYSTVSVNNVVYNIDTIEPNYVPYHSTVSLFPTVVRNLVYGEKDYEERYSLEMANTSFNTFTFYANYLKDFGIPMTLGIVFILQLFISRIYLRARNFEWGPILAYPALFMATVLSIFSDYFMSLPILFQIFIAFRIGNQMSKKI